MRALVVFRSYLGTTRQYAEWLVEEVDGELLSFGKAKYKDLSDYNVVVIMSGTYVGWMPLVNYLKSNWDVLKTKKL